MAIGVILVLAIAGGAVFFINNSYNETDDSTASSNETELTEGDNSDSSRDDDSTDPASGSSRDNGDATNSMAEDTDSLDMSNDDPASEGTDMDTTGNNEDASSGSYVEFASKDDLTDDTNVIFFAASWCPSCRSLDNNISENIDSIPSNMSIFKADYDAEEELKREYGVTTQHTLVQVDMDGNLIKKWSGSFSLDDIIEEV